MKITAAEFLSDQCKKQQPVVTADLTGKTVVVVGANMGLGFEACKHFARMNPARLVMACRSQQRGEEAIKSLEEATGYKNAELSLVDVANYASCREFAKRWQGRLDILVMNAAVIATSYAAVEGWETTIKINHLGIAFVILLFLPHVKATAKKYGVVPRVVVVSSDVHYTTTVPQEIIHNEGEPMLQKLSSKEYCTGRVMLDRYGLSKLLGVFFVRALTENLKDSLYPIIVNMVNPGYCYSGLRKGIPPLFAAVHWVLDRLLALTTEEGSRGLVYAAIGSADDEERLRGGYVSFNTTKEVSDCVLHQTGKKCQERLWTETIEILSAQEPMIRDIANGQF